MAESEAQVSDMTDEQIVETLASFMGWTWEELDRDHLVTLYALTSPMGDQRTAFVDAGKTIASELRLPYLESRDALSPALAKLTDEQWLKVNANLSLADWGMPKWNGTQAGYVCHLLTCPPRVLATAISEAVKGDLQTKLGASERECDRLRKENAELKASVQLPQNHQRLCDLVRHQRSELHRVGLITDAEYESLLAVGSQAARRLESYDDIRANRDRLQEQVRVLREAGK